MFEINYLILVKPPQDGVDVKPDYRAIPMYFQGISFLQYQLQMRSNKDSVVFGNVF